MEVSRRERKIEERKKMARLRRIRQKRKVVLMNRQEKRLRKVEILTKRKRMTPKGMYLKYSSLNYVVSNITNMVPFLYACNAKNAKI